MGGLTTVAADVRTALAGVCTWKEGAAALVEPHAPPSIIWVPGEIQHQRGNAQSSRVTRAIGLDVYEVMVQCWGTTEAEVELLRQAVITAVRRTVRGANYDVPSSRRVMPRAGELGHKLVMQLQIRLQTPVVVLPAATAPAAPAMGDVHDDTKQTATIHETELDPSGEVPGDGELVGGAG